MFTFPKRDLSVADGMSTLVVRGCDASAGVNTCDVCDGEVGAPCFGSAGDGFSARHDFWF